LPQKGDARAHPKKNGLFFLKDAECLNGMMVKSYGRTQFLLTPFANPQLDINIISARIKVLFDYFCVCVLNAYPRDLYSHMVSRLCVGNVYYETLDSGYTFPLAARFRYIHFVFLSRLNWATLKAFAMTTSSLMAITTSSRITHKASSSFYICDDNAHFKA
jgi:hypothetical protein